MKLINFFLFFIFISINCSFADINKDFENWKLNFKKIALENNISEKTFDRVMSDTKFLSDVIKYDRYQPCLLYTSPSPRDQRGSRMPSSA